MMDVSKLTPLPLRVVEADGKTSDWPIVANANGFPVMLSEMDNLDDLEFFVLARRAFEVMLRRGWGVVKFASGWAVAIGTEDLLPGLRSQRWDCPFAALVAADEWLTAHERSVSNGS